VLRGVVPYSTWCAQRCGTLLHLVCSEVWYPTPLGVLRGVVPYSIYPALSILSSCMYPIQLHVSYPAACILSSCMYPIQLHVSYPAACILSSCMYPTACMALNRVMPRALWLHVSRCMYRAACIALHVSRCMYRAACIALNTCPELTCPELSGKALCCCCVPLVW